MLVVRAAGPADLDALMELAVLSGRGFTSLPADEAVLSERLARAEASFAGSVAPAEAWYTLMLEDTATGAIAGIAGVRAAVGIARPHFSFRVMTMAQYSAAIGTRFDHQALVLVNECNGWTEVGSLFVRPDLRSAGAGSLLARSRYLLIGADPLRFSHTVMAELRGWFDAEDRSPFWHGVGAKFFRIAFEEADRMVTASDGQFILDLAPRHPIYVELMEPAATDAIGRVHRDGERARVLLEHEGFERSGLIDIFDGGPTMICQRDALATVRNARELRVAIGDDAGMEPHLLARAALPDFRATRAPVLERDGRAVIGVDTAKALHLREGDVVRVSA